MKGYTSLPKAVQDCHVLIAWIIPQLDKFPRQRRNTLGERIETGLLEVLEWLVEAAYSHSKTQTLHRANLRLDRVRHLWRIGHELKVISGKSYAYGSHLLELLGRQIGGWQQHAGSQNRA
ncbi:MAG: diversity-generating retroelement protein Avd [Candidatus Thiodiazotropha sp.]